ncbi:hypothetical protein [Crossiella sp. CA198]|uniref:hypothetical protein n=1 Tax=Crossiella sp. CA198 TaxID=3455607 RepID=UPI003F8D844B
MLNVARKRAPRSPGTSTTSRPGPQPPLRHRPHGGNIPLFTPEGTQQALVSSAAGHLASQGALIAGFSLNRGYTAEDYDTHYTAAGLTLAERYATWDREPFTGGDYAVSVHRVALAHYPLTNR